MACKFLKEWSGRRESNPQPTAWKAVTLPLSYSREQRNPYFSAFCEVDTLNRMSLCPCRQWLLKMAALPCPGIVMMGSVRMCVTTCFRNMRAVSSVGQSVWFTPRRSGVRGSHRPPIFQQLTAQLVSAAPPKHPPIRQTRCALATSARSCFSCLRCCSSSSASRAIASAFTSAGTACW